MTLARRTHQINNIQIRTSDSFDVFFRWVDKYKETVFELIRESKLRVAMIRYGPFFAVALSWLSLLPHAHAHLFFATQANPKPRRRWEDSSENCTASPTFSCCRSWCSTIVLGFVFVLLAACCLLLLLAATRVFVVFDRFFFSALLQPKVHEFRAEHHEFKTCSLEILSSYLLFSAWSALIYQEEIKVGWGGGTEFGEIDRSGALLAAF